MEGKEQLINPISGEAVDEIIKEKEARKRGYLNFKFLSQYLEDENEFVKYFVIEGRKVVVDLASPDLQRERGLELNHERIHAGIGEDIPLEVKPLTGVCSIDNPESCEACGS